jgi:transcriptional regulator with XRE-family HTH domain
MYNQNNLPIGNNIRKWRNLRGFKQQDFAKDIGVSKGTLSKIENGKQKNVNLTRLQKIATCLKVKITQLFNDPNDLLPPPMMINYN